MGRKERGGKKNTITFRLPVNTGVRADTFAEDVPLQDINNFVLTPDGSAIRPREGSEIRYSGVEGVGVSRKTIFFLTDPPDINYGDLVCIVNNKNGNRVIEQSEVVKAAVIPDVNQGYVESQFRLLGDDTLFISAPYTSVDIEIERAGDTFGTSYVNIRTVNGTATAGSDYTAVDQMVSFAYGSTLETVTITLNAASANLGKEFTVELYNASPGSEISNVDGSQTVQMDEV